VASETWSDEDLSAWLDGEITGARGDAIAQAVESDPALAARIEKMSVANDALRLAIADELGPVPVQLSSAVRGEANNVVAFRKREQPAPQRAWMRMAATVLVAIAAGAGAMALLQPRGQDNSGGALVVASNDGLVANSKLGAALSAAYSGERAAVGSNAIKVAASFRASDDRFCRQFHVDLKNGAADAIACRTGGDWQIEGWSNAPKQSGGYETAGGPDDAALNAVTARLGTKQMLDRDGEAAAIKRGWAH
jgi:anti-sigma factor RsiW